MMKKKYIIFALAFVVCSCITTEDYQESFLLETLFRQNDERLLRYDAVREENKQIVWREEFDNNDSKWPVDTAAYSWIIQWVLDYSRTIFPVDEFFKTIQMSDGYLKYFHRHGTKKVHIPFTIDESKNFEIEKRVFFTNNIPGPSQARIIFEFSPSDTLTYELFLHRYSLGGDDRVDIGIRRNRTELFSWNFKDFADINDFSTITVRKIGGRHAFFINHKLFYILNDSDFSVNKTFLVFCSVVKDYKFDYVRVSYIID